MRFVSVCYAFLNNWAKIWLMLPYLTGNGEDGQMKGGWLSYYLQHLPHHSFSYASIACIYFIYINVKALVWAYIRELSILYFKKVCFDVYAITVANF